MKFLLRRHGDGFGDWLFTLCAIKHVNLQCPDVDVYVDFKLAPHGRRERIIPPVVPEAFRSSDVRWYDVAENDAKPDRAIDHLVYPLRSDEPYVAGMLKQLELALGRELTYRRDLEPIFIYPEWQERPRLYVAMVSCGKGETAFKSWGVDRFEALASLLRVYGVDVVHVGLPLDYELKGASLDKRGVPFETLCGILAGSVAFVGLENGLSVLAKMLKRPTLIAYMRNGMMPRLACRYVTGLFKPTAEEAFAAVQEIATC